MQYVFHTVTRDEDKFKIISRLPIIFCLKGPKEIST